MIVKHDETWKSFKFVLTTDLISGIYLNTHLKNKNKTLASETRESEVQRCSLISEF